MDAYQSSVAVAKLRHAQKAGHPLRLAFLDLDGTWAGSPEDQQTVRDLLESQHYIIAPATSRTPEMCMTSLERERSNPYTASRPFVASPAYPEQEPALQGLLSCDIIIGSSGTRLFIRQESEEYRPDEEYEQYFPDSASDWHASLTHLLNQLHVPSDSMTRRHDTPPYCRIELRLEGLGSAEELATQLSQATHKELIHVAREGSRLFLTPAHTSKEDAVNHVTNRLTDILKIPPQDIQVLIAGDSTLDIPMGLSAASGTEAVFLIPGRAPITSEIQLTKAEKDGRLSQGIYRLPKTSRTIVIGDEAFPDTVGPETLIAWLTRTQPEPT